MSTPTETAVRPATIEEIQTAVLSHPKLRIQGGGTKPALTEHRSHAASLQMDGLAGIIEYDPAEYTITAYAGTPLRTLVDALAANGQYMPFDPPWIEAGATLGGTIAAGVSGSQRHRYGSLRDFLIGVRFVDGQGRLVRGGGKVVKNAAGFDLPKLMIGSRGEFGVLVEASLKVFPAPPAYGTLHLEPASFQSAAETLAQLARSSFDLYGLDLLVAPHMTPGASILTARIGGTQETLQPRLERLRTLAGGGELTTDPSVEAQEEQARREVAWVPADSLLVKCAVTLESAGRLEAQLEAGNLPWTRLYTNGINSLWLAASGDLSTVHEQLYQAGISGVLMRNPSGPNISAGEPIRGEHYPYIGRNPETIFHLRIRQTLDPEARFRD